MKTTFKVNTSNIPDELQPLVKDEMTRQEIALLGNVILRMKIDKFKNKIFGWWYNRKRFKNKNKGSL